MNFKRGLSRGGRGGRARASGASASARLPEVFQVSHGTQAFPGVSRGCRGGPEGARALLRPRKIPAKPPSAPADSPKSPAEFFKSPRLQGLPENARRDAEIPPKEPTTRPQKRSEGVQCTQQHFLFSQEVHGVLFPRATMFYTCIFFATYACLLISRGAY